MKITGMANEFLFQFETPIVGPLSDSGGLAFNARQSDTFLLFSSLYFFFLIFGIERGINVLMWMPPGGSPFFNMDFCRRATVSFVGTAGLAWCTRKFIRKDKILIKFGFRTFDVMNWKKMLFGLRRSAGVAFVKNSPVIIFDHRVHGLLIVIRNTWS